MSRHTRFLGLAVLGLLLAASPVPAADEEGFKPIFDGKSLEGWDGNPEFWRVEDGAITGQTTKEKPTKGNTFLVWRAGQTDDFELKLEYRIEGGNSGIQFRSFEQPEKWGKWVIGGYQADIDASGHYTGILYGERYDGILAGRGQKVVLGPDHKPKVVGSVGDSKEILSHIKKGDWNEFHIIAQGNHIVQKLNGQTTVDVTDEGKAARSSGLLALQLHAGPPMKIQFRNIRLKPLKKVVTPMMGETGKKKIVIVSGRPSHGYASHEHHAGCLLLAKWLNENVPNVEAVVHKHGWPKDPAALDGAAAIVVFSDGGGGHPMKPYMDEVEKLMKKGVGLACIHYAVEIPKGKDGDRLKSWIGGYFETHWSVNPHWRGEFQQFPKHPVANGLKPFFMDDEWYYHMRFIDDMKGVTPILSAVPPDKTRERPDGPHSGNPTVRSRKGMPEHVCWVYDRPEGGRGFGFTGGHWHWSWACDSFRTVVLNGIAWVAGCDIPPGGVPSKRPTLEELEANQDYEQPKNFDRQKVLKLIEEWNK